LEAYKKVVKNSEVTELHHGEELCTANWDQWREAHPKCATTEVSSIRRDV